MKTIPATVTTPKIVLDTHTNVYSFEGESYPEDVNAFFDPIMVPLKTHLKNQQDSNIQFDFFLTYFNSASTKVFACLLVMCWEWITWGILGIKDRGLFKESMK